MLRPHYPLQTIQYRCVGSRVGLDVSAVEPRTVQPAAWSPFNLLNFHSKPCKYFYFSVRCCVFVCLSSVTKLCSLWCLGGGGQKAHSIAFLSAKLPNPPWGLRSLLCNGYRGSFPGIKWPPPSSAEVNNEWSHTSAPPAPYNSWCARVQLYSFTLRCLIT